MSFSKETERVASLVMSSLLTLLLAKSDDQMGPFQGIEITARPLAH